MVRSTTGEIYDINEALSHLDGSVKEPLLEALADLEALIKGPLKEDITLTGLLTHALNHKEHGANFLLEGFKDLDPPLFYHADNGENQHTYGFVLRNGLRILKGEIEAGRAEKGDATYVALAAAFHDTGFWHCQTSDESSYDQNEPSGAYFARKYMIESGLYTGEEVKKVEEPIFWTDISKGKPPAGIPAIVRDGDLSYIGDESTEQFHNVERRLKDEVYLRQYSFLYGATTKEMEELVKAYDDDNMTLDRPQFSDYNSSAHKDLFEFAWHIVSLRFMQKHEWNTETAQNLFEENKERNMQSYILELSGVKKDFEMKYGLQADRFDLKTVPELFSHYQPSTL